METIDVFIDGQEGTTGLQIVQRLEAHPFVRVQRIPDEARKDEAARRQYINRAGFVFLCLPDPAAVEAASLVAPDNRDTRIVDASTAHRVHPDWVYGLPELSAGGREAIADAKRVANPGCHATAFLLSVRPLVEAGWIPVDYPVSCHSITGYSGGGKAMIREYEDPARATLYPDYDAPREYALGQAHKHLPEMFAHSSLAYPPAFSPIVADYPRGLAVYIPLEARLLKNPGGKVSPELVWETLASYYDGCQMVTVKPYEDGILCDGKAYVDAMACNGTDRAELFVLGNRERMTIVCRLDNLGKGAAGAAIQNMNLMMGFPEATGLIV